MVSKRARVRMLALVAAVATGIGVAAVTEPAEAGHLVVVHAPAGAKVEQVAGSNVVNNWTTYTGQCYQSSSSSACNPIYKTVWHGCADYSYLKINIYTECTAGTVYSVRGLYVWGSTATVNGLRGTRSCHTTGSGGANFTFDPQVCGEHRVTLRYDKVWDGGDLVMSFPTPGGNSFVVQQHVNCYDTGVCYGPYIE